MPHISASIHLTNKPISVKFDESHGSTWLGITEQVDGQPHGSGITIFLTPYQLWDVIRELTDQLQNLAYPTPEPLPEPFDAATAVVDARSDALEHSL